MICARCIYDDRIPYITFDSEGVCNYCHQYDAMDEEYPTGFIGEDILRELAGKIKAESRSQYDVVVGVSGGCDSSYMLHLCKQLGLNPLAAHFDNTWNSRIAVENIANVTRALDVDLYTDVCDGEEYNDIFRACLMASIPESDLAADIGLATTLYNACVKYKVKYIFEGHCFRTEGITPHGWVYMDARYRDSVHRDFGICKDVSTVPNLYLLRWFKWLLWDRIKKIRPLYYLDYRKEEAKELLSKKYGWQWYGGHHMENRTAYFANNYWLPKKFGVDLRLCEYAALVRSGQMNREDALKEVSVPAPFDVDIFAEIKKRLVLSDMQFQMIMEAPNKSYRDFKTYKRLFERLRPLFYMLYKANMVPRSFYDKFTVSYEG